MDDYKVRPNVGKKIVKKFKENEYILKNISCDKKGKHESDCNDTKKSCLCVAESVCNIIAQAGTATVTLPPNSCITKIYTAGEAVALNSIQININNGEETIFCYRFYVQNNSGHFETTLVQPLCVGENGATVSADFVGTFVDAGFLTVVYCTDCCE